MQTQTLGHLVYVGEIVLFFLPPTQSYPQPRAVPALLCDFDPETNQADLAIFAALAGPFQQIVYTTAPNCDPGMPIPGAWAYRVGRDKALTQSLVELNARLESGIKQGAPHVPDPAHPEVGPIPRPGPATGAPGVQPDGSPGRDGPAPAAIPD